VLRGDLPRLSRAASIVTSTPSAAAALSPVSGSGSGAGAGADAEQQPGGLTHVKRSKPLKYAYEKEIVLYAHHQQLKYFSTECIYSPEAFRGGARALVKDLERVRPSAILDLVRSGEDLARLCPGFVGERSECQGECQGDAEVEDEQVGGCGRGSGSLALELGSERKPEENDRPQRQRNKADRPVKVRAKQTMGICEKCGYMSSQAVCKACLLLEGLNRNRPKTDIEVVILPKPGDGAILDQT
jgi:cytoplasmic tRNA 2-thiolation protein 1